MTIRRWRSRRLTLALAIMLLPAGLVTAQHTISVRPGSRVLLIGKSNIRGWTCATSTFVATATAPAMQRMSVGVPAARPIELTVVIPVRSMNCGVARMNRDMLRALKADSFPEIRYVLSRYAFAEQGAASDSFFIRSVGNLTVAGVTRRVEIPIRGARNADGDMTGSGSVAVLMTDFGVTPPTAFFGAIRARNALEIRLEMRVSGAEVQALSPSPMASR